MSDTLGWKVTGTIFADGSSLKNDWNAIYDSNEWHWQYDTHELSFKVYEHDGQYWKLYHVRYVHDGDNEYTYDFGGQACRMALVKYRNTTKSPHSSKLMQESAEEWVRTYEVNEDIHDVLKMGEENSKYGAAYGAKAK